MWELRKVLSKKNMASGDRNDVGDILKWKEIYMDQLTAGANTNSQRFNSPSKYGRLNEMLFEWFKQAKNMPVSGPLLQEKATMYAAELGFDQFKASNGWLERWKTKHSVKFYKVCGESGDVDNDLVSDYKEKIKEIVQGVKPEDVYNCDETGLFFRAVSDKSLSLKGDRCKGGKLSKERLTVMLACSATGDKLKPLVIGKSYKPRCFKNPIPTDLHTDLRVTLKRQKLNSFFAYMKPDFVNKCKYECSVVLVEPPFSVYFRSEYIHASNISRNRFQAI